jgi:topoisomerase-4 subunit A
MATDSGYGFLVQLGELNAKNRAGKALLTVPDGSHVLVPLRVADPEQDWVALCSLQGRLLLFPAAEIPRLNKGKGNKLLDIKPADLAKREDHVVAQVSLSVASALKVQGGKRTLTIQAADLEHYRGSRGRRGNHLPRGFQRVESLAEQTKD